MTPRLLIKRMKFPKEKMSFPGTWVVRIKRFSDGRLRNFKGRFCDRGDRQIESSRLL